MLSDRERKLRSQIALSSRRGYTANIKMLRTEFAIAKAERLRAEADEIERSTFDPEFGNTDS